MLVFASLGGLLTEIKKNDRLCGGGDGPLGSVQERCYLTCSDFASGFSKAVTVTRRSIRTKIYSMSTVPLF